MIIYPQKSQNRFKRLHFFLILCEQIKYATGKNSFHFISYVNLRWHESQEKAIRWEISFIVWWLYRELSQDFHHFNLFEIGLIVFGLQVISPCFRCKYHSGFTQKIYVELHYNSFSYSFLLRIRKHTHCFFYRKSRQTCLKHHKRSKGNKPINVEYSMSRSNSSCFGIFSVISFDQNIFQFTVWNFSKLLIIEISRLYENI